eukprot:COSAG06_NODE_9181_length_1966_cov_1.831280_2_plen_70_part_00
MKDENLAEAVFTGDVNVSKIDDTALRILTPMFQMGLFDERWLNNVCKNGSFEPFVYKYYPFTKTGSGQT